MMAKKCTKLSDVRSKLLFCQSKPNAFLPFSLPSPSSLLKILKSAYVKKNNVSYSVFSRQIIPYNILEIKLYIYFKEVFP